MKKARDDGVGRFWESEIEKLDNGLPTSRPWTPEQQVILRKSGSVPGYSGHHRWGVKEYPHLARDPLNIQPLTRFEHLQGWHGGSYSGGSAVGVPLRPDLLIFLNE
jgi:hypothetical protein